MEDNKRKYMLPISILIAALIIGGVIVYTNKSEKSVKEQQSSTQTEKKAEVTIDENFVIPQEGVELPVKWGNLGVKLVDSGVIDKSKFEALYSNRGGLDAEAKKILYDSDNGNLKITSQN